MQPLEQEFSQLLKVLVMVESMFLIKPNVLQVTPLVKERSKKIKEVVLLRLRKLQTTLMLKFYAQEFSEIT